MKSDRPKWFGFGHPCPTMSITQLDRISNGHQLLDGGCGTHWRDSKTVDTGEKLGRVKRGHASLRMSPNLGLLH